MNHDEETASLMPANHYACCTLLPKSVHRRGTAARREPLKWHHSLGIRSMPTRATIGFELPLLWPHLSNGVSEADMAILMCTVESAWRRAKFLTENRVVDDCRLTVRQHGDHRDVGELRIGDLWDLRIARGQAPSKRV